MLAKLRGSCTWRNRYSPATDKTFLYHTLHMHTYMYHKRMLIEA
jgi:hypothetical protein